MVCSDCIKWINNIVSMIYLSPLILAISTNNHDVDGYLHKAIARSVVYVTESSVTESSVTESSVTESSKSIASGAA